MTKQCPLCELEKLSHWYVIGVFYKIVDCITCNIPMVVYDYHKVPTNSEIKIMLDDLKLIADSKYGKGNWYIRDERKIKNHFHKHAVLK